MSKIVHKSLSIIWVIYGIVGALLVLLSTILILDEEIFMYVAVLYGILGIILLIRNKYNKPNKELSFEEEFREDLENLEKFESTQDNILEEETTPEIDKKKLSDKDRQIERISANIRKHGKQMAARVTPQIYDISDNQTFEAFSTSANNGLFS